MIRIRLAKTADFLEPLIVPYSITSLHSADKAGVRPA